MTKDDVLALLKKNSGSFTSGEALAASLHVSRMSINKAVRALEEEGFNIEAVSRKGYRLLDGQVYNERCVKEALSGLKVFFYPELEGSSNTCAKVLANQEEGPFIVVCETQSGGRGRLGRSFSSPKGGVYFSLVLPSSMVGEVDLITTRAALAVALAVEEVCGIECSIKWVNDLYVGGRKFVGILTEGIVNLELGGLDKVVIGIGINLNTTLSDYPEDLGGIVTTIADQTGRRHDRLLVLQKAVENVIEYQKKDFLDEYRRRCFVLGRDVFVLKGGKSEPAHALDVDEKAHLVVRYPDGRTESLSSAEVSLRF